MEYPVASNKDEPIPPIPTPTAAAPVPPVEPAPKVAKRPVEPPAPAAWPNPYANTGAAPAYGPPVTPAPAQAPPAYAPPTMGPPPAYAYGPGVVAPASGLSIASMILGIASVVLACVYIGGLVGIGAVITGHLATRRQPHARGFWLTGLITGYVGIAIGAFEIIVVVIIFVSYSTNPTGY